MSTPSFDELKQGDFVKVRVGNERIWFAVLSHICQRLDGAYNAVLCSLASDPVECVFDARVTIDRDWILESARQTPPELKVIKGGRI